MTDGDREATATTAPHAGSPRAGPRDEVYDVVVVGAGLGGISAAAVLAKAGRKVLVVERQDGAGGYARAVRRGPYLFDPAIHVLAEAGDGRFVDLLLRHLGVRGEVDLVQVPGLWRVDLPGWSFHAPVGTDDHVAALVARFPHEAAGIRAFFGLTARFFAEATHLSMRLSLRGLDTAVERFPTFFAHRTATVGAVLDSCCSDPRAKAVIGASWPYLGLPPSRLSFLSFALMLSTVVAGGLRYCRGSFQRLADAFVTALERDGGEVLPGTAVRRILVQDGAVRGVRLAGGREVRAPVVVSNADATRTLGELVGEEHLPPALIRRVRRMQPSTSAVVVYGATALDLAALRPAHEAFLYRHWDHDTTYADILAGRPGGMWANVPTLVDPSLAPEGQHLVILTSLAPRTTGRPWRQEKERYAGRMLADFDQVYPGVREHLEVLETATPDTLEAYTGNRGAATYGWALTPGQTGSRRTTHHPPIGGLYLSGHWTDEGPGSFRVLLSGVATARMVLEDAGLGDALPELRPSELPDLIR